MKDFEYYFKKHLYGEQILGAVEGMTLQHVGHVKAKTDTGNNAHNVLHAVNLEENNGKVKFDTVNNKTLTLPVVDHIQIHIGENEIRDRPVIKLDCSIGTKTFSNVSFSLADRSENDCPVLLGEDFIKMNGGKVDININNPQTQ